MRRFLRRWKVPLLIQIAVIGYVLRAWTYWQKVRRGAGMPCASGLGEYGDYLMDTACSAAELWLLCCPRWIACRLRPFQLRA